MEAVHLERKTAESPSAQFWQTSQNAPLIIVHCKAAADQHVVLGPEGEAN